jgi:hypothetical protein
MVDILAFIYRENFSQSKNMSVVQTVDPVINSFTDTPANKVQSLITEEGNLNLKLRVFGTGGGCSGF